MATFNDSDLNVLAERFCAAPLPASAAADLCATDANYPSARFGTNLLTVDQAKEMLRHVLQPTELKPLRVDWNKHDLAEAYDLVEGVRRQAAQHPESGIDTSLRGALDAIEAADCEWDGLTEA